jgi:ketosteroid isomerase-like protein
VSQENVEVMRRVIEAWNRNEEESVMPLFDPDVIVDATRRLVNPKTYAGIEGVRAMLADRDEVWEEFRFEPDEFLDAGDRVLVIGRWVGQGRGSGVEVVQPIAHIFTLRDGRIVRSELGYSDRGTALKAAGLSE